MPRELSSTTDASINHRARRAAHLETDRRRPRRAPGKGEPGRQPRPLQSRPPAAAFPARDARQPQRRDAGPRPSPGRRSPHPTPRRLSQRTSAALMRHDDSAGARACAGAPLIRAGFTLATLELLESGRTRSNSARGRIVSAPRMRLTDRRPAFPPTGSQPSLARESLLAQRPPVHPSPPPDGPARRVVSLAFPTPARPSFVGSAVRTETGASHERDD